MPLQQQPMNAFPPFPSLHPLMTSTMIPLSHPQTIPVVAQQITYSQATEDTLDSAVETVLVSPSFLAGARERSDA